ncbi:MAG: hypothetical protein ACYC2O_12665, partial [Microthrixaceae bacterium]
TSFETASKGGDPIQAAWVSLFQPWGHAITATPAVVLLVVAVVLGAVTLRVPWVPKVLPVALLAMAAVAGVVTLFQFPQLINGLFAAAPVLVFGFVFLRRSDAHDRLTVRLAGVAVLAAVLLTITIYANPGAQWGGRFFHVLLPLLVPLTVLGLDRAFTPLEQMERRAGLACLVVATLALSTLSLRVNVQMRRASGSIVATVQDAVQREHEGSTLVLVVRLAPDGLSRIFWDSPHREALLALPDPALFLQLAGGADVDGVDRVVVITELRPPVFGQLVGDRVDEGPWSLADVSAVEDAGMYVYEFVPKDV